MTVELLKILVQPVALERDSEGRIVGEKTGEPVAFYDPDKIPEYIAELQRQLKASNGRNDL